MKSLLIGTALAALALTPAGQAADSARYEIRFDATWTAQSHPLEYPSSAHFSGLVGATHTLAYRVFRDGNTATPGLKALSERGAHSPLTEEIGTAVKDGNAGTLFESQPLFKFPGTISATFTVDEAHPYVSAAAMVAPSPDWFTGISSVQLRKDGKWVQKLSLPLLVWDAGTDNGTIYEAADAESMPRQSVRLNASPHFMANGTLLPVGTVTITQIRKTASN